MPTKKKILVTTVRYFMSFPSRLVEEPIFYTLSTKMKVIHNTVRGRITSTYAKVEVELTGKPADIARAVKYLKSKGVSVKELT